MVARWLHFHDAMSNPVLYYRSVVNTCFRSLVSFYIPFPLLLPSSPIGSGCWIPYCLPPSSHPWLSGSTCFPALPFQFHPSSCSANINLVLQPQKIPVKPARLMPSPSWNHFPSLSHRPHSLCPGAHWRACLSCCSWPVALCHSL